MSRMKSETARAAKRRPLTATEKTVWSELGHILLLSALAENPHCGSKRMIFHGGTSLHLAWDSPRLSEDLDFLLDEQLLPEIDRTMRRATTTVKLHLLRMDAQMQVELKNKSNSRMGKFSLVLSKPGIIGNAIIKAEFWGVSPDYLQNYRSTIRTPLPAALLEQARLHVRIRSSLPVATLDSVFCDKLVAMSGRKYIKWRDVFDLWWIQSQRDFNRPSDSELVQRVLKYASAYRNDPNSDDHEPLSGDLAAGSEHTRPAIAPDQAQNLVHRLRAYAANVQAPELVASAREDLRRFLVDTTDSDKLWQMYWPDTIMEMIQTAAQTTGRLADLIDAHNLKERQKIDMVAQTAEQGAVSELYEDADPFLLVVRPRG